MRWDLIWFVRAVASLKVPLHSIMHTNDIGSVNLLPRRYLLFSTDAAQNLKILSAHWSLVTGAFKGSYVV
jgi:hypothetical protein